MYYLKRILLAAAAILFVAFLLFSFFFSGRIPENPTGTLGNTPGNLINKGLFCENDGKVYFANAYDDYSLYSMNPDGTQAKKLTKTGANYINAAGDYLYYYQTHSTENFALGFIRQPYGVFRCKKNGNDITCLTRDASGIIQLVDNALYYQHYTTQQGVYLDRLALDKSSETTIMEAMISPASVQNGVLYYNETRENHHLYAYDMASGSSTLLWEHDLWNPIIHGEYIYFMDLDSEYELHRYHPVTGDHQVLTTDRVDTFNVYGNKIYYQKNDPDNPALIRMNLDGSGQETVAPGNYENLNMTSQYVYFNAFNAPTPVFCQSLNGPISVSTFTP
ncbi:MAG: DUF5050 domain-containing protein [Lachnospiraceae bacterium]|nr:DUF5050 domain-containing protein [Lachnospiraceae bacterium]